jgi:hypothetical protein
VALGHQAETAAHLSAAWRDPDDDGAAVVGRLLSGNETVLHEQRHLPPRGSRIHVGQPGQLAYLQALILLDTSQQLESGLGDDDPGGGGPAIEHLATGVEPEELLERALDRSQLVFLRGAFAFGHILQGIDSCKTLSITYGWFWVSACNAPKEGRRLNPPRPRDSGKLGRMARIAPPVATMGPVVRIELERVEALELLGMTLAHLKDAEARAEMSPRVALLMAIRDKLALGLREER